MRPASSNRARTEVSAEHLKKDEAVDVSQMTDGAQLWIDAVLFGNTPHAGESDANTTLSSKSATHSPS